MAQCDYYDVLELGRDAQPGDIKRAYRKLAMKYHPDRSDSPESESRFKEASEAYEVLSDPKKRQLYDVHGHAGLKNSGFSGFSGVGIDDIFSSFGDIFGDFFGGSGSSRSRRNGVRRGGDVQTELRIDFTEAVFGCTKKAEVEHNVACDDCDGSGAEPGAQVLTCGTCQGRGQVMHGQGMFVIATTCPECSGQGRSYSARCNVCAGTGLSRRRRDLNVKVPAGFDDGMSLRYNGEGEPGQGGGPAGDLYVHVRVRPHASIKRDGDDLYCEVPISMVQATLGDEIECETVDGLEKVAVPKGTQPNDVITLKRKGVPRLQGSGRGNMHVVCKVEIPRNLTGRQKDLLEEFASLKSGKKKRLFS